MGKADVLARFATDLANPGSLKSGEYLRKGILTSAQRALDGGDREGLVSALQDWLGERSEPKTMLAVDVIRELQLSELREGLEELRTEIESGAVFKPFYVRWVDDALGVLRYGVSPPL